MLEHISSILLAIMVGIYWYEHRYKLKRCCYCTKFIGQSKSHGKDKNGYWHFDCRYPDKERKE